MSAVVPKKPGGVPVQHGRVRVEGDAAKLRLHAVHVVVHVVSLVSLAGRSSSVSAPTLESGRLVANLQSSLPSSQVAVAVVSLESPGLPSPVRDWGRVLGDFSTENTSLDAVRGSGGAPGGRGGGEGVL